MQSRVALATLGRSIILIVNVILKVVYSHIPLIAFRSHTSLMMRISHCKLKYSVKSIIHTSALMV